MTAYGFKPYSKIRYWRYQYVGDNSIKCKWHIKDTSRSHLITRADPPICSAYSKIENGFSCYHGATFIAEKYGTVNLFKFIARIHLTGTWKSQYVNAEFNFPTQPEVDSVLVFSKQKVATGWNMEVPGALPTTRGRPVKNTVKRRRYWFELRRTYKNKTV